MESLSHDTQKTNKLRAHKAEPLSELQEAEIFLRELEELVAQRGLKTGKSIEKDDIRSILAEETTTAYDRKVAYTLTLKTSEVSQSQTNDQITVEIFSGVCDDVCATRTISGLPGPGKEYTDEFVAPDFGRPTRLRLTISGEDWTQLDWVKVYNGATGRSFHFPCPTDTGCPLSTDPNDGGQEQIVLDLEDHCAANPCVNGDCVDEENNYTCTCHPGYEGTNCDKNINDCDGVYCENGGTCVDDINDYSCECADGFEGEHCETDINECDGVTCENGGTCVDGINDYSCDCAGGYEGEHCETDIDNCDGVTCENGGTCVDGINDFFCDCADGFEGEHCETEINPCDGVTCENGGTCVGGINDYSCHCADGFEGEHCETEINACDGVTCENGGTCVGGINDYSCRCADGYEGEHCETDINDCTGVTCENGGTCVDRINGYSCHCADGFEGEHCETDINDCTGVTCENGGTCVDGINGYSCHCADGFEGEHCETDINDCTGVTCENGGTCVDGINGYSCHCADGFEGEHCETETDLTAFATCTNEFMELAIPSYRLDEFDPADFHWFPDKTCRAQENNTFYIFHTGLYDCGTQVTFDSRYVIFTNHIFLNHVSPQNGDAVIVRMDNSSFITTKCNYKRDQWVESNFLPIPGGLNFTEEGFGQLEIRLSMFPTRKYQSPYQPSQYPISTRMGQHIYMQLEVQGHGQKLSVLALNCKATMSSQPNGTLQYPLIKDGCASDPTLKIQEFTDHSKERFSFEAFHFVKEWEEVYVHCEVLVCDGTDSGSRCAQGCTKRAKRATGEKTDMRGRHMIYQGPIILDDDTDDTLRLMSAQETVSDRHSAPWAMLAAGGGLMALALVVMGAAIVLKRSRREEWTYQGLPNMADDI
ncbi:uncharacterized protein LOC144886441 [Branchiostoma floridae x Branchiostoma japonicum]